MSFTPHYHSELDMADRPPPTGDKAGWAIWLGLAAVAVYLLRWVLLPFALAAGLAYICYPPCNWLRTRLRLPHALACLVMVMLVMVVVGGFGYLVVSRLAAEAGQFARNAPRVIEEAAGYAIGNQGTTVFGRQLTPADVRDRVLAAAAGLLPIQKAEEWAGAGVGTLAAAVLICVLLFYLLYSGQRLVQGAVWLLPPARRTAARRFLHELNSVLAHYFRGVFAVFIYTALAAWVGIALLLRLPHAVLLALLMAVLELIPVVGPATAALILGVVAVAQGQIWQVIAAAVFCLVLRLSIDQFIGPLVLGRAVTLHPVTIIFAFLAGGAIWGLVGVILAVPAAAVIKLALAHAYGEAAEE